jgi:hypothetical protein
MVYCGKVNRIVRKDGLARCRVPARHASVVVGIAPPPDALSRTRDVGRVRQVGGLPGVEGGGAQFAAQFPRLSHSIPTACWPVGRLNAMNRN